MHECDAAMVQFECLVKSFRISKRYPHNCVSDDKHTTLAMNILLNVRCCHNCKMIFSNYMVDEVLSSS